MQNEHISSKLITIKINNMKKLQILLMIALFFFSSCAVIRPGEVGVKQRMGVLADKIMTEGAYAYNPITTRVVKTPIRTENLKVKLNLPSKEGLNVAAEISILYSIDQEKVPELLRTIGAQYQTIVRSVFRSSSADVCSKFPAKDMHSGKRANIEDEIQAKMSETLTKKGIIVESVLLKSISLPSGLYSSIEDRLQAEQNAMRMRFTLEQEKLEAERKIIEAKGNRDAQIILSEGLTKEILQLKGIEAFVKLSQSTGAKVIITGGGETPFLLNTP